VTQGAFRIDVVAVAVQLAVAEEARAAEDVEWHQYTVARLERLDRRADLFDDADEFMAEGVADAGVGHQAVVQVQVRAADAGAYHADDGVARVFDHGIRFLRHPDPVRSTKVSCQHKTSCQKCPALRSAFAGQEV